MPGAALVLVFQWVSLLGSLLVAGKLFHTGLYRRYRVFFAYFIFRAAMAALPLVVSVGSPRYFFVWIFTAPINLMFYVWVVLELCALVLARHQGLYTLGKWAMYAGMAISVTLSILSLLASFKSAPAQRSLSLSKSIMQYFVAADRGVTFCLAIFLILMLLLLSRYPVPLSRNVVLHAAIYTVFFFGHSLSDILADVFGVHLFTVIDTCLTGVSALCILAWLLFLNVKGEEVRVNVPRLTPENEKRILYHLDSLNSTLLKVAHIETTPK